MKQELTLSAVQHQVDCWIKEYGIRYFAELTNLGILMEETGELARLMVREYGEQSFKETELPLARPVKEQIADEMADVLWVLVCLANQTGVNLTDAFTKNMLKKTTRDHTRHGENPKLS